MHTFARFATILVGLGFGHHALAIGPTANHAFGTSYFQQNTTIDTAVGDVTSTIDTLMFKYGWSYFRHLGIEAHAGFSASKVDEESSDSFTGDYLLGVFVRGSLPLSAQNMTFYGLAGFSRAKATFKDVPEDTTAATTSYTVTASGVSYGLGVELFGTPSTAFHIEWMKYLGATDLTSDGFVFGLTHHFAISKLW